MILFHHRAELAAGDGFAPSTSLSKSDELLVTLSRIGGAGGSCNLSKPDYLRRAFKSGAGLLWLQLREMVGERGLAPPRLADSRSAGSAIPS